MFMRPTMSLIYDYHVTAINNLFINSYVKQGTISSFFEDTKSPNNKGYLFYLLKNGNTFSLKNVASSAISSNDLFFLVSLSTSILYSSAPAV